jgi:hypothetical protein
MPLGLRPFHWRRGKKLPNPLEDNLGFLEQLFSGEQHEFHVRSELLHKIGECGIEPQTAN